ncbi:MAG TPA: DUF2726 domain-containing protein [Thermomicrobiales bacterium]
MGVDEQRWWRRLLARLFGERSHAAPNRETLQPTTDMAAPAKRRSEQRATVTPVQGEMAAQDIASTSNQPVVSSVGISQVNVGQTTTPADYTYALRDDFLSHAEQSFFHVLRDAVAAEYLIFPKVRLADLVFPPRQEGQFGAWQRINRKHVDFVLCDPRTLRPRAAIELDDRSHRRPDRLERDAFVERVFGDAALPLIRIPAQRTYHRQTIAALITEAIVEREPSVIAVPVTVDPQTKLCDRCGGEMKLRTAAQGAHRGEQFWGCTNFPKCRNIVKIAADPTLHVSA